MLYRDVIDVGVARVALAADDDRNALALASGVNKIVLLLYFFFCIGINGAAGGSSNVRSDVLSLSTSNRCES